MQKKARHISKRTMSPHAPVVTGMLLDLTVLQISNSNHFTWALFLHFL